MWIITLDNVDGVVDYGLALHGGPLNGEGTSFFGPGDTPEGGASVVGAAGEGETITVNIAPGMEGYLRNRHPQVHARGVGGSTASTVSTSPGQPTDAPSTPLADSGLRLRGVHPNPFNPRTTVAFELPQAERVVLEVYDIRGRKIRQLLNETRGPRAAMRLSSTGWILRAAAWPAEPTSCD